MNSSNLFSDDSFCNKSCNHQITNDKHEKARIWRQETIVSSVCQIRRCNKYNLGIVSHKNIFCDPSL